MEKQELNNDYISRIDNAERRFIVSEMKVETRAMEGQEDELYITGYAAKYNNETNLGYLREIIMPGAFDDVMNDDVRALKNHDENFILGRTTSKTLEVGSDQVGLTYRVRLDKRNTDHMNLYYSVERGDISQSSFAFTVKEQAWEKGEGNNPSLRKIVKVEKLYDVSPVTYPAYSNTSINAGVALRSMKEALKDEMPKEDWEHENRLMRMKIQELKSKQFK